MECREGNSENSGKILHATCLVLRKTCGHAGIFLNVARTVPARPPRIASDAEGRVPGSDADRGRRTRTPRVAPGRVTSESWPLVVVLVMRSGVNQRVGSGRSAVETLVLRDARGPRRITGQVWPIAYETPRQLWPAMRARSDLQGLVDLRGSLPDGAHRDAEEPFQVRVENTGHAARSTAAGGQGIDDAGCPAFGLAAQR